MKDKKKDEAYYVKKIEDLKKLKIQGIAPIVEEDNSVVGNIEVWSTDWEVEEVKRPPHGNYFVVDNIEGDVKIKCLMV